MKILRSSPLFLSVTLCLCFIAALLLSVNDPAQGQTATRYVATTGNDRGDCAAPGFPCRTVQYAVDQASNFNDVILVASGVYSGVNHRGGLSQMVYLSKDVTIRGGYTPTFAEPPDPGTNLTVLDALGAGRVLYITGDIAPVVEGFRITGGDATGLGGGLSGRDAGGGIYVTDATAIIRANEIISNTAERGAGLCLNQNASSVCNNRIHSNTAGEGGGGLDVLFSQAKVIDNVIQNNAAYRGAGLVLHGSAALVQGNTVAHNRTDWDGAGMFIHQSDGAILAGNSIIDNSANAGGAIYLNFSDAELTGNVILSNTAHLGGGLFLWESNAVLRNNVIVKNSATNSGAALYILGSSPRAFHQTIARNSGGDGTGVYVTNSPSVLSGMSFTNTILVDHGVGVYVQTGNLVTMDATLWGSGVWSNAQDWYMEPGGKFSSVRDHWLAPGFAGPEDADYHLGPHSPAIDRGVEAGVALDLDGEARWGLPDLGADEFLAHAYLPMLLQSVP